MNRRSFLASGVAAAGAVAVNAAPAQTVAQESAPISPFTDADFGFAAQISLGHSYYRAGEPGKLLAIVSKIKTGDFESAWAAYLAAASYFSTALRFLDGTEDPARMFPCWQEYAASWSAAAALFNPPIERLEIPYQGTR